MKILVSASRLAALGLMLLGLSQPAWSVIEDDADHLKLRKECEPLDNCFETMQELTDWLWTDRPADPSQSAPIVVEIGPGDFGRIVCPNSGDDTDRNGWTTFRGSGRDQTRILGSGDLFGAQAAATIVNCEGLAFEHLTIEGTGYGVSWHKGGSSTWTDVHIRAGGATNGIGFAWYDNLGGCPSPAVHYFFASKLETRGASLFNVAYEAHCTEVWFYGGEIQTTWVADPGVVVANAAILVGAGADVRVFGSALRANAGAAVAANFDNGNVTDAVTGVLVQNGGVFHMHGGIINADASSSQVGAGATAVRVETGGFAHTPGTGYVVKAVGSGAARRVQAADPPAPGQGAQLPFLWQPSSTPPTSGTEANKLESQRGQDLWVETDCNASGDCDSQAGANPPYDEAHLMVYDDQRCPADPWFDTVTARCRNDTVDPVADALADLDARVTALESP